MKWEEVQGKSLIFLILFLLFFPSSSMGHFCSIFPSDDILEGGGGKKVEMKVQFFHPFTGGYLDMAKPVEFGVIVRGRKEDLTTSLREERVSGKRTWRCTYAVNRPGTYVFYVKPVPYFEPAEGRFIVHYTKVYLNAFGLEEGWDIPLGLPVEIVPLTRPFAIWTGNVFRGQVLVGGKPAPGVYVEVEYLNEGREVIAPRAPYETQVVKTDASGVFAYALPREGWWGFAALTEGKKGKMREGKKYPVEVGGVLWVRAADMR